MKNYLYLLTILLALISCEKPNVENDVSSNVKENYRVPHLRNVNGILSVENADQLFKAAEAIGNLTESEYKLWQDEIKFKSQYTDFNEAILKQNPDWKNHFSMFLNEENGRIELNNVNTNYSKITNPSGLIIIGDSLYQFSATAIKSIEGYGKEKVKYLLSSDSNDASRLVTTTKVVELTSSSVNGRVAPWEKFQKGNDLLGIDNKDGRFYLRARLKAVSYVILPLTIYSGRQSIDLTASFYRNSLFTSEHLYTPQKFESTWSFTVMDAPCGVCVLQPTTLTGSYNESGVHSIARTIFDTWGGDDITNMNLLVSASAYNGSGDLKTSSTTFLFTE